MTEATGPRILYLLTAPISSVLVRGQLDWLASHGFDVHVGVGPDDATTRHRWDSSAGVHAIAFARTVAPISDLRALAETIRLIRRLRPDIVNASTPKAGLLGMLAARCCRTPVRVYVIRGLRFETMTGAKRRFMIRLERIAARCATHILTNSRSAAMVARDAGIGGRTPIEVIAAGSSNGVDVDHYATTSRSGAVARRSLDIPPDACVIGFVGRLTRDKGIVDLMESFEALRADRPALHLLLVGDHEAGDPLDAELVDRLRDHPNVTHLGWVDDTMAVYPAIDVLAFPSAREGLPNVPLQAQAASVPVVAYAATGTVDALDDGVGGLLVPNGDNDELTFALAALVDDPARRHRMGAAGRNWVRDRFDQQMIWEALTERYRDWTAS